MPRTLHIRGSRHPRPAARRVAYCDGGTDTLYRDGVDIELSHWIPNRTPAAFKASTSTEIVLRFVEAGGADGVDLVVNNHVDTDGMLSVFALLQPDLALAHRQTLVQAATIGDFHGDGDEPARHLQQAVALARLRLEAAAADPQDIYVEVHALVKRALAGEHFAETAPGLAALHAAEAALADGRIRRQLLAPRLVQYRLPAAVADVDAWLPAIDQPLTSGSVLPPQARARLDFQRLQLLSAPAVAGAGWQHLLCAPGYSWAETVGLWRLPGLQHDDGINAHRLDWPLLDDAARRLDDGEQGPGRWSVARTLDPFRSLPGCRFPVLLARLHDDRPTTSAQPPEAVAAVLADALKDV